MCLPLIKNGEMPTCVATCPQRALEWGPLDMLKASHPEAVNHINNTNIFADPSKTNPSIIFKLKERLS